MTMRSLFHKRMTAALLAVVMVLSLLPGQTARALAADPDDDVRGSISATLRIDYAQSLETLRDREVRVEEALQKVAMFDRADHKPTEMSGGQQQRVAIARAIAPHPPIIMADEPTGALDSKTGRHVLEILHALHQEMGTTVILITHDNSIAATAERVVRISDGKIIYDGDKEGAGL